MKFKVILIGDSGAGKTSLILRLSGSNFTEGGVQTLGSDFKTLNAGGLKFDLWDTGGQVRRSSNSCTHEP